MWMNFVSLTQMRGKGLYNCKESSNGFIFFPFLCDRLIICIANLCDWNWVEGCVCNFRGAIYYYKCKWKWAKLNFTGWLSTQLCSSHLILSFFLFSFPSCVFLPVPPVAKSSTSVLRTTTKPLQRKMWYDWPGRSWTGWPFCIGIMWCIWIWR